MIPTAYSLLEQHTWRRLQRAWARAGGGNAATRSLLEYNRAGWEFHAKGIWCAALPARLMTCMSLLLSIVKLYRL